MGSVEGVIFNDTVAAISGGSAVSVTMLGVDLSAVINFNSDGVLGMTPTTPGPEQLFVTQLFEGGVISENCARRCGKGIFSIFNL